MNIEQLNQLNRWFYDAATGICQTFAFQYRPLEEPVDMFENIAVIGFSGDSIRGTVGVAASEEVIDATFGEEAGDISTVMRLDSLGEIVNQLMGRLKNQFYRQGVDVTIATPLAFRGLRITVGGTLQDTFLRWDFSTPQGSIVAWLDCYSEPDLVFEERDEEVSEEGSLIFF